MLEINLLPWREVAREKYQSYLCSLVILSICLVIILLWVLHVSLKYYIEKEKHHVALWQQRIDAQSIHVNKVKEKCLQYQQLQSALIWIKKAESRNALLQNFVKNLISDIPYEINFSDMVRSHDQIILLGTTPSALALSKMIKKITVEPGHKAQIVEIKNSNSMALLKFQLQVVKDADRPAYSL